MQITDYIFINLIVAGSSKGVEFEQWELDAKSRPRFGRNWWFWLPNPVTNGGRFKPWETTDIGLQWLCFSLSLTVYSRRKRNNSSGRF
tara:strand:+ start:218 stop:481 length:264 start_codon:yes stop_codon:yes gene_type:complete